MASAVSRISRSAWGDRSAFPTRSLWGTADSAGRAVTCSIMIHRHFIGAVDFYQSDVHVFFERGRHVLADVIGLDGQLTVAAIHEHDELDFLGTAEIDQGVECRTDRASRIEHVVHEEDLLI